MCVYMYMYIYITSFLYVILPFLHFAYSEIKYDTAAVQMCVLIISIMLPRERLMPNPAATKIC